MARRGTTGGPQLQPRERAMIMTRIRLLQRHRCRQPAGRRWRRRRSRRPIPTACAISPSIEARQVGVLEHMGSFERRSLSTLRNAVHVLVRTGHEDACEEVVEAVEEILGDAPRRAGRAGVMVEVDDQARIEPARERAAGHQLEQPLRAGDMIGRCAAQHPRRVSRRDQRRRVRPERPQRSPTRWSRSAAFSVSARRSSRCR